MQTKLLFLQPMAQGYLPDFRSVLCYLITGHALVSYYALAKRTPRQTQVENLSLLAAPFGQALRPLAFTLVELTN